MFAVLFIFGMEHSIFQNFVYWDTLKIDNIIKIYQITAKVTSDNRASFHCGHD